MRIKPSKEARSRTDGVDWLDPPGCQSTAVAKRNRHVVLKHADVARL